MNSFIFYTFISFYGRNFFYWFYFWLKKRAQANIITRREETASTRSLLNTAKLMEENAMLFKLKEMEYVEKIAERINSISLSGSNQIVEQFKTLFSPK